MQEICAHHKLIKETSMDENTIRITSVAEAARQLNASKFTLYRKIKERKLPAYQLGRKILVDVDELLEAMRMK